MATYSIGQWAKKAGLDMDQAARGITISMFNSVVDNTRVGNPSTWQSPPPPGYVGGRLKGNWQTSSGMPASGTLDRIDGDGNRVKAEIKSRVEPGTINYITNNLPYAEVWNERDAIIDRVVARTDTILRQEAAKARR